MPPLKKIEDLDFSKVRVSGSLYDDRPLRCYYCNEIVTPEEHAQVQKAMNLVCGEVCDSDIHIAIAENSFVHMTQALPSNLDDEANVVICPRDFVREISENGGGQ